MSHTPPSRTPSRASTPALPPAPSSRLIIPILRPSSSRNNMSDISPDGKQSQPHPNTLDSSASSVVSMDISEGILLQDVDVGVDTAEGEDITAMGSVNAMSSDESKKTLREHLKETLSYRQSQPDLVLPKSKLKGPKTLVPEIPWEPASNYPPREYFVLTDAGKPVFCSRQHHGNTGTDNLAATIGIMQALISVFIDDGDKLRCINAGNTRITFLTRSPLYYACVSSWGEPESVTRSHLEYLHLQILSIVTAAQLRRIFERRGNFDLRRLLDGTESFLTSILQRLEFDIAMGTSSLQCLKIDPHLRKRAADALTPTTKVKDILYVILIANGQVVTLIRPRKHSIHPADIHILLNTIHSPSISSSLASASFVPVCLPKFNPSGFVNAYVSFLRKEDSPKENPPSISSFSSLSPHPIDHVLDHESSRVPFLLSPEQRQGIATSTLPSIALVCISGGAELETVRGWCDSVTQKLTSDGTLDSIFSAICSGQTEYPVTELGIPGLRHFVYKSRGQVQVTLPLFEDPYDDLQEKRRLITLYQVIHDAIHAKSGQGGTLKLQYIKTDKESVMGWITQPFELYLALSPWLPKSAVIGAANSVARWVKKEESRLFLKDAPVF